MGNFLISFMVPIEVPIHKYFSEPQNYNPDRGLNNYNTILGDPCYNYRGLNNYNTILGVPCYNYRGLNNYNTILGVPCYNYRGLNNYNTILGGSLL